jgi:hypothetical protein
MQDAVDHVVEFARLDVGWRDGKFEHFEAVQRDLVQQFVTAGLDHFDGGDLADSSIV